ncbi:hypothetical protein CEXT_192041, partial [Caerostris extrusa]
KASKKFSLLMVNAGQSYALISLVVSIPFLDDVPESQCLLVVQKLMAYDRGRNR